MDAIIVSQARLATHTGYQREVLKPEDLHLRKDVFDKKAEKFIRFSAKARFPQSAPERQSMTRYIEKLEAGIRYA